MTTFSITWDRFTVHKKHDIDRDRPYLWVYGIVVDVDTLVSGHYVVKRRSDSRNLDKKFGKGDTSSVPSDLDIVRTVKPIGDTWAGGVVVVAWENATTKDSVIADAYDAGAEAIEDAIADRLLTSADPLASPTPAELAQMGADVETAVRDAIKDGLSVFQLVPDHNIGHREWFHTFDGSVLSDLDFRFVSGSTDYELEGRVAYTAVDPKPGKPVEPSGPPPKGLQSPKPQATLRR